jgi:hypothetical protein
MHYPGEDDKKEKKLHGIASSDLNWYCLNKAQNADLLGKDMVDEYKMCIRKTI